MLPELDHLVREAGPAGLALIAFGAFVEYVFPPFPGDAVTAFGGLYAVRGGWPAGLVFALVMAGSLASAFVDYGFGLWPGRRFDAAPADAWHMRHLSRERLQGWEQRSRTRGIVWLLVNRFLPAVRGPIFVAAGVARMPAWKVLVFGGLSALVWNALLFGAGYAVGGEAERLGPLLVGYSRAAWLALAAIGLALAIRSLLRRRRRRA
jgi:membrane protein DedA with SNARE-associated domain